AATVEGAALAWLLAHPAGIVPVIGTGRLERIEQAVESLRIDLSREDWFRVWTASQGRDVP
ncbi:MAG: aldo/keto reductase, partial [Candidatus Krumholzibacteria bacterium]|nr:aldo/keto reductase [Candidatus Krumholzibacteria bacterium]